MVQNRKIFYSFHLKGRGVFMGLRVVCRAIVLDPDTSKLLLVRNQGANYWYAPGGGWDYDREGIKDGAMRETEEETGVKVIVIRLVYVQEFRPKGGDDVYLEQFWLAHPIGSTELSGAKDLHGIVEEARWFSREEMQGEKVFPERLKDRFWHDLSAVLSSPNPFID
ncbi:NUDIX hydrolase [Patescibacteria group bacterium]|nr:NUDIX hydrolase [Patescibacteria group bacterium]